MPSETAPPSAESRALDIVLGATESEIEIVWEKLHRSGYVRWPHQKRKELKAIAYYLARVAASGGANPGTNEILNSLDLPGVPLRTLVTVQGTESLVFFLDPNCQPILYAASSRHSR